MDRVQSRTSHGAIQVIANEPQAYEAVSRLTFNEPVARAIGRKLCDQNLSLGPKGAADLGALFREDHLLSPLTHSKSSYMPLAGKSPTHSSAATSQVLMHPKKAEDETASAGPMMEERTL